jgi:tetratricopeptide (TPR) repeat protein
MRRYYPGNHSIKHLVDRFLILSLVSILLEMGVCAQSKKAVVILKPTASTKEVLTCEGQTELKFHTLYNLKLNGEKHVRLAQNISAVSDTYPVSRDDYDRARSIELENLDKMEWQEGLLYAASGTASLVICLPSDGQKKVRPDKKMPRLLREFYDISVEGESKEAGSKQKLRLPLGSIWKIYIINEADKPDEALFRHATEEASIGLWKEYLKITTTHRVDEAMTALCQSLINCVEAALKRFQEGKYAAIEVARKGANAAVSLCYKEHIQGLLQRIDEQENAVRTTIAKGITLSNEEKWDECWTTLGPVKKYADELPNLNETYNLCREHSHALHLAAGKQHLQAGRLEDAKKEFDIALLRIPDSSEAKQGRRETVILITLRDSQQLRRQGRPGEARQLVKRVLSETEYTGESRLTEELRVASCEYSNQLYDQARRLVTAPQGSGLRSITNPSDKKPFKEAREKLIEATETCSTQQVSELLLSVNRRLSEYHLAQARRALARKASATAYLHSMAAQTFHPENDGVASVCCQVKGSKMVI